MSYNANGGQRRSSSVKLDFPVLSGPITATCELCGKVGSISVGEVGDWEIQSFGSGLRFLACPDCKKLNPIVMLEKYEARKP